MTIFSKKADKGRREYSCYNYIGGCNYGCYYHEEKEPVAQCPSCGKYLCKECARLTQGGIRYDCTKKLHDDAN